MLDSQIWERVLWKKQRFSDNYVGESFLRVSRKRLEVSYLDALYSATIVSQEICSCFNVVSVFYGLSGQLISPTVILAATGVLVVAFYIFMHFSDVLSPQGSKDLKVVIFACILIWGASPLVKTLTGSVSADTVYACTIGLLLLHLIVHPYGAHVAIVNSTMSHNLGLFASVCLASQLTTSTDVFTLMMVAVAFFTLYPSFRAFCQMNLSRRDNLCVATGMVLLTLLSVAMFMPDLMFLLLLALVITDVVIPVLFVYLQYHKQNIYGPWDEAQIQR